MRKGQFLWKELVKRKIGLSYQEHPLARALDDISNAEFDEIMAEWERELPERKITDIDKMPCKRCGKTIRTGDEIGMAVEGTVCKECHDFEFNMELSSLSAMHDSEISDLRSELSEVKEETERLKNIINTKLSDLYYESFNRLDILWRFYLEMQDKASKDIEWKDTQGNIWKMPCKERKKE